MEISTQTVVDYGIHNNPQQIYTNQKCLVIVVSVNNSTKPLE